MLFYLNYGLERDLVLATVLFNYIYWTFGFLRMGTTGPVAQAVGRDDPDAVLLIGVRHGLLALILGLLILLLQQPLQWIGFTLLSATPEVRDAGEAFYHTMIWGAPATLLNFVLVGWFLGRSESRVVLAISAVNNGVNVLLDYLFIVRLGWNSSGAGLATALSQYLMLLAGMVWVCRLVRWQQLRSIAPQLYDSDALQAIFLLNREIFVRTFALVTTFSVFTNLSSAMGTLVLTTNAVLLQVVTLAAYFIDGVAFATESLAGLFQGQGQRQQLKQLVQVSGWTSLALGLSVAIAFIGLPRPLFQLLTDHNDMVDNLSRYVGWLLPVLGFGAIAFMLDGYFLGLTQGRILRQSTLIATLVGFVPMAGIAAYWHSPHLLWLALSLFMAGRAITLGGQVWVTLFTQRGA